MTTNLKKLPTKIPENATIANLVERVKTMSISVDRREKKFTEEERYVIVSMLARCYSNTEIKNEIMTRFQKNIDVALLQQYKRTKKWVAVITKLREEYLIDVPMANTAHKRVRLERLDRIYDRAVENGDLKNQLSSTTQAWKEMEGNKKDGDTTNVFWNNPVYQQINALSTEELIKRQQEATKKLTQTIDMEELNGPDRQSV